MNPSISYYQVLESVCMAGCTRELLSLLLLMRSRDSYVRRSTTMRDESRLSKRHLLFRFFRSLSYHTAGY